MKRSIFTAAALALVAVLPAIPAQAASVTRTFVSASGNDNNNCTITQPCATFARAYTLTLANGIIAALDPGKYGPLTITGPITINGYGWASITAPANGNGITINANSTDGVTLTGLAIDGAGAVANGIVFNSGGSLVVSDCVARNFSGSGLNGNGILIRPSAATINFAITNSTFSNNTIGIAYNPPGGTASANGFIDRVIVTNANAGGNGISFNSESINGGHLAATITNSIASNNGAGAGVFVVNAGSPSTISLSIDNLSASGNGQGILANGTSNVLVGHSVISGNVTGLSNTTSPNTFYTYGNNQINLNTTADFGGTSPNTAFTPR
jgi:hypothetical protein